MGTQKRERQKANRQKRLLEEARVQKTETVKRTAMRWTIAAVLAVGAVVLIAWIGGAFSGDDDADLADQQFDTEDQTDLSTPETAPVVTAPPVTTPPGGTTAADPTTGKPSVLVPETVPTELVVTEVSPGEGEPAKAGDLIEVNYVGVRSVDGVEFDSSWNRGSTFSFQLGEGQVIQGWDEGLVGATAGSLVQLDIPAELAYGDADRGVIRPGDALSFVVEVVSITPGVTE